MKRYNCTSSDKRGAFGLCMEEHKEGAFVPFSEVSGLAEQLADATRQCGVMADLLREAIGEVPQTQSFPSRCDAALAGKLPDRQDTEWTDATTSPVAADYRELQEQHDALQSKYKAAQNLVRDIVGFDRELEGDDVIGTMADRIDALLADKLPDPAMSVTETIRTAPERIWLQVGDQGHYHSEPFPEHHDEVSWCSDSVVACEVPYVRADLAGNIPAPVGGEMRTVTVSGKGLLELVDFTCPDHETDREQQETEIVLLNREAFTSTDGEKMPRGVYAYLAEYPEEGLYGPVGCQEQHGDKSLNQNPAATTGQPASTLNKQPSLTGQVLAGMGAATLLAGLDKESASDVVQLMLEAAEAKGGGSCATEPRSSSQA